MAANQGSDALVDPALQLAAGGHRITDRLGGEGRRSPDADRRTECRRHRQKIARPHGHNAVEEAVAHDGRCRRHPDP